MMENLEELAELMGWATLRDSNNPMIAADSKRLLEKLAGPLEKRGVLLISMIDLDGESMRTDMTVQISEDAHPMTKLLLLVAKTMVQDFMENLRDRTEGKPNPSKLAVQHFMGMVKAAFEMDRQQKAAEEDAGTKVEVKHEG